MKHLKLYEEYNNSGLITDPELVEQWLQENLVGIEDPYGDIRLEESSYTVNPDGTVDVDGDVYMQDMNLTKIPVWFGKVSGVFYCSKNQLTSLQGAPKVVDDNFNCRNNKLTSLQGAPSYVDGNFYCSKNQLTSLQGAPSKVGGWFDYRDNFLTIETEYIVDKGNPGYEVDHSKLETLASNFHEKVKDHPNATSIVLSLKETRPQVFKHLEKFGYDQSWFERNQNMDKHKDIFEF